MIDVLVSPRVTGPWLAQQKETPALESGHSPKTLLSCLTLDNFLFIDDSPTQSSGDHNSTIDFATRQHPHQSHRQRRQLHWQKPQVTGTQTRRLSSTPTDSNMASMQASMCHHHDNRESFICHEVSTRPSSLQNQATSVAYRLTAPAMKTTHSSSGISSTSQLAPDSFDPPENSLVSTKVNGSHELFQSMAGMELNWPSKTPPYFGSGTESSPSLSSSFDFMDVPKEEPIPYGLPLLDSAFMAPPPKKVVIPESQNTYFIADTLPGSSKINSSLQWSMGTETESWHSRYHSDRLAWPASTTLTSSSWPISEHMEISCPDTQLIAPYNFTHNSLLSPRNHHASIPSPSPMSMSREPDYSSVTPLGMGTFQTQIPNIQPTYTGLPSMPEGNTSFPASGSSTIHTEPPHFPNESPTIEASLHYSDARNALLIEWKRAGLSYKDIKRMGGFKEAESTLRGRFRTLTKAKEQRVRKPKWLKRDIHLLCEAITVYADPASPSSTGYTSLAQTNMAMAMAGQPPKVSWKKVAQYIWSHGGSYQFGNATCKKKWCDIHGIKI